jgi:hypothetical protein
VTLGAAERHLAQVGGAIVERLRAKPMSEATIEAALRSYLACAADPLVVAIMRAIRADPALRQLDRVDTDVNAERVARALRESGIATAPSLTATVVVGIEMAGAMVLHLADRSVAERGPLIDAFVDLVLAPIRSDRAGDQPGTA